MGEIFLARQQIAGVNRLVVLKRLLPGMADDAQLLAMFIDEARIAANLAHPGIVQVHEFGQDAQGHFIVMEYVPGRHLGELLARARRDNKPIPNRYGAYIVHEVARALDHAHRARDSNGTPLEIVHRDISPSNVLVSFRGDVKLMDFGVARAANRAHRTNDGSIRGKFAYMAPEQIESKQVDARTDIFALGVLLWEVTLGRRLFTGPSDFEVIRAALEQPIPRPSSIDPSYPAELESLAMSALERVADRRLASAAELAAGLKSYLRANPTDRDDLTALMTELFPDDVAESVKLEEELTRPKRADPRTLMLPHSPRPAGQTPDSPRVVGGLASRRWLIIGLVLASAGGAAWFALYGGWFDRGAVAADAASDTELGVIAPAHDASPGDAAADAGVDLQDDASDEHTTATRKDAGFKPAPPRRDPPLHLTAQPRDAAIDAPVKEVGGFHFFLAREEDGPVFLTDNHGRCSTDSVQTRCAKLPVGSVQRFTFSVPGSGEFAVTLRTEAGLKRCEVRPAKQDVACQ